MDPAKPIVIKRLFINLSVEQYEDIRRRTVIKKRDSNQPYRYKYVEGFNNAVKHDVKFSLFINQI